MDPARKHLRVLYSFPHKIGAGRICTTAWHQVEGLSAAGVKVTLATGSICRALPAEVKITTTLQRGPIRIPYRILGTRRACIIHDWFVSRLLRRSQGQFDLVHLWPLGGLRTMVEAKRQGIPALMERPNAHTRFAYEVVQKECRKLGITMPPGHEHDYDPVLLAHEEREYLESDFLLCPSDFVAQTFRNQSFPSDKLLRHQYGFDERIYQPPLQQRQRGEGLTMIFVGGCAPRKGLHYALDAWLKSTAHRTGTFLIAGAFIPGYAEVLSEQLSHPSVKRLGHRTDVADLMRSSDILTLPSIEEGSALVTSEARGSGCVLIVSDAAGAICRDGYDGFVHRVGDTTMMVDQLNRLDADRSILEIMRNRSMETVHELTWRAAGRRLEAVYREAIIA
jgi:glycosyltransferase involved in cell wall biosynthesis